MWTNVVQCGLDTHRKFSILAGMDATGKVVRRERLEHNDRQAMLARLRCYLPGTPVVLEGSFGWGWVTDLIGQAGLVPRLANSRKVAKWRENRGLPKSNRKDAELLSELCFEKVNWWEAWMAPPEVRRLRELMRHRAAMVKLQTSLKNRIHAVLHRHGIQQDLSDLFGREGRQFLEELIEDASSPLPDSGRLVIHDDLALMDQVRKHLAKMLKHYRRELRTNRAMKRLKTLPGIGLLLSFTIGAEIGDIRRFKNHRKLASYSLLAPIADDSGDDDGTAGYGRHVGYIGRVTLKWAFIEAAHGAVNNKGGEFHELFNRLTDEGKRDCNRGYIAVARRLCQASYVLVKKDVDYDPTRRQQPGSQALSGNAPEPERTMVVAKGSRKAAARQTSK